MIFIGVCILEIAIAIAIRYLLYKSKKIRDHKLIEYILFFIYLVMAIGVAYGVTDNIEGLVRLTLTTALYGFLFFVSNKEHKEPTADIALILLMPILILMMLDAVYFVLVSPSTWLLPVLIISTILWGEFREYAFNLRRIIVAVIGITLALALIPILTIEMKEDQTIVEDTAINYVQNELGYDLNYVYVY